MLDAVLRSVYTHCGVSATEARTLIVADGYLLTDAKRLLWKRSRIDAAQAAGYDAYVSALRRLCGRPGGLYAHAELLEQPLHCGFALGVARALLACRTPHVIVVQHDRPMMRRAPLRAILDAMETTPALACVALPTGRTLARAYAEGAMARYKIDLAPHTLCARGAAELGFCPLLQFYDSTHVARVADYRTLFGRGHFSRGDRPRPRED